jgi:hypothetical protein
MHDIRMVSRSALSVMLLVGACSTEAPGPSPTTGNAELGIVEFRVTETRAEREVIGVDANGATVGRAHLRIGFVEIPDIELAGMGRDLEVNVNGERASHVSVGFAPLSLPYLETAELNTFLLDPYVAHVLAGWQIELATPDPALALAPDEVGYTSGSCSDFPPPCSGTNASSCCLENAKGAMLDRAQNVVCPGIGMRTRRMCKAPKVLTSCGMSGDLGCAICWSEAYTFPAEYSTNYAPGTDTCGWFSLNVCGDGRCDTDECSYHCYADCGLSCIPN